MAEPKAAEERAYLLKDAMHTVLNERERGVKSAEGGLDIGYGKWWARVRGPHVLVALIVLLTLTPVCYLIVKHDETTKEMQTRVEQAIQKSNDTQEAILWVNSLSESDRMKLNLSKPRKIREMQVER